MAKTVFHLERSNEHALSDRLHQLDAERDDRAARQDFLRDAFARLGLPVPGRREYIETVDCGHLLFLTAAGCTLRLEQADPADPAGTAGYTDLESEFVLQPLGRIDGPGMSLCVYPGLFSPWGAEGGPVGADLALLTQRLKQDKIHFFDFDARGDNIGYLPFVSPQWPRGIPVVIDPGAVARLSENINPVKRAINKFRDLLNPAPLPAPVQQADLYGDLRGHFAAALEGKGATMDSFWAECIISARAGRLQADWVKVPENFKSIPSAAQAYDTRIRAHTPAFRAIR